MLGITDIAASIRKKQEKGVIGRNNIYFRGQRSKDPLVPSLLRNKMDYHKENQLYCDCMIMSGHDVTADRSSWETLALFQHYGIPTRLLDWSASLIHALYFAASKCLHCQDRKTCGKARKSCHGNPTLWILDPVRMHSKLYPRSKMIAFTVGIDKIPDYFDFFVKENKSKEWEFKKGPIFMEIPWTNPRIKNQRGYFTFHPNDAPLDSLLDESSGLHRIDFTGGEREALLSDLETINIGEFDIYTDLISLASHLKHIYGLQ